ncbi:MAG: HlyD family type I secretion periplasmic adaptor subunit [Sphingomonadales bacterium]|nr:HlyD family type I secretion periplasmic adaptor subunit [Sphingomonadales bacterium]
MSNTRDDIKNKEKIGRTRQAILSFMGRDILRDEGNPYARFLSRSVLLEEAGPPRLMRAAVILICVLIAAFIIWATFTQLDERAEAIGEVLPINFVQPVQHLEGGIVAEVRVREGELVKAGQALIILDETATRAEYESLSARLTGLKLRLERLKSFAFQRPAKFPVVEKQFQSMLEDQKQVLQAQINSREARIGVINAEIQELVEQREGLGRQMQAMEREEEYMREEVLIRKGLLEKGLNSRLVYLAAERNLARTHSQMAQVNTNLARVKAAITSANQRILELEERIRNDALGEMGEASNEASQVEQQIARMADRVRRTTITSPVDGRVNGLRIKGIGAVIGSAEVLMEIVPIERELVAEVRVKPSDIGHVKEGAQAFIRIDTFNYARFGGITGTVERVSASSFRDPDGNPFFMARVVLDRNYVGHDPLANHITPGMTLVADIKTGQKSLMSYMMRPIYNTLRDSFSER